MSITGKQKGRETGRCHSAWREQGKLQRIRKASWRGAFEWALILGNNLMENNVNDGKNPLKTG